MAAADENTSLAQFRTRLEDLVPGVNVNGVVGSQPVDVVAVRWHGANFVTLTYRDAHGKTDQTVLSRDREAGLRLGKSGQARPFDGDAELWRLAAEALRIRYAALFDPMLAIATSDMRFEVLTRSLIDSTFEGNVFEWYPQLIARMDQLSRNQDLLEMLDRSDWDLVVVDEAHRMSAHYFGGELKTTKRVMQEKC